MSYTINYEKVGLPPVVEIEEQKLSKHDDELVTVQYKQAITSLVSLSGDKVITTSKIIASFFKKRHDHVIRDIEALLPNLSDNFRAPNFGEASETVAMPKGGTRQDKIYNLTRDGAVMVIMGYTGKEAIKFKEDFINAFNIMEAELIKRNTPNLENYVPVESANFLLKELEKEKNYSSYMQEDNIKLLIQIDELKSKIDPAQAQTIKNAVGRKVKEIHTLKKHLNTGKIFSYVWRCVYNQFNIPSYKELHPKHLDECLSFIDNIDASNYNPQTEAIELTEADEVKQEAAAIAPNFDQAVKAQVFFTVVDAINNALLHAGKVLEFTHDNLKRADSHFKDQDRLKNKNYGMARACIENALYGKSEHFQRYSDASIEDARSSVKLAANLIKSASGMNVFAQAEDKLLANA